MHGLYPSIILASCLSAMCYANVVTYDFNITWVDKRSPDNAFERPVIGINGQWPIPHIVVDKGDRMIVNVHNQLGDEPTSLVCDLQPISPSETAALIASTQGKFN